MNDNKISTIKYRGREGWNAKSQLDLADNRVLQISTYKASNGSLRTSASVHTKVDGGLRHVFGYGTPGGDFSGNVAITKPARVTEKVVAEQHALVLDVVPELLVSIENHYAKHPPLDLSA
ncbi:hypothetical protein LPB72_09935 [Hydrogenophaga crassostreae]|uniref:Jacalin-type lectin domain-containing protein n=1 Tax=Hydrogenophaga crassostreae TaxID=1763535 RepID=A0A163CEG2_9BURK|nr:hypothetical protein [Hydrogenophaga crassostreae]AOW13354.1 hypothetical protein LPB072_11315 [Hydrogenophaga crassostreae]OAD41638.1 hypothetical protein LPB72_09935 [Hydrogenophaga crassostreae]